MLISKLVMLVGFVVLSAINSVSAHAQSSWQSYKSSTGWTSFSYPPGWTVTNTDLTPSRYVENYGLQPRGQNFEARPGQISVRIFDPTYIIEGARLSANADWHDMFRQFVVMLPGGQRPTFTRDQVGGKEYFLASNVNSGFETLYVGFLGMGGYINIVGIAAPPRVDANARAIIYGMAGSLRSPGPSLKLNEAEQVAKQWYDALQRGDRTSLVNLSCSEARQMMAFTFLGTKVFGGGDAIQPILSLGTLYDFSELRYQTMNSGPVGAAVRISGNMKTPQGTMVPFSESNKMFGSNVFIVKLEQGKYRLCEPFRPRR